MGLQLHMYSTLTTLLLGRLILTYVELDHEDLGAHCKSSGLPYEA
jgi:hypothetical protein